MARSFGLAGRGRPNYLPHSTEQQGGNAKEPGDLGKADDHRTGAMEFPTAAFGQTDGTAENAKGGKTGQAVAAKAGCVGHGGEASLR